MQVLDTSGLKCPLPVLKAKKAIKNINSGEQIKVIATDPGAMKDFQHFCKATGDTLESAVEEDNVLTFIIRKKNDFKS